MEGLEGLAYDDPQSDSDARVMGADCPWGPALLPHTLSYVTPHMLGSPMERWLPLEVAITMEVHVNESELDDL